MHVSELIGSAAAVMTTLAFLPQAVLALRTRETAGISLAMYALFTTGVALWFAYGLLLGSWPIIIANAITFALAACVLWVTVENVRAARRAKS